MGQGTIWSFFGDRQGVPTANTEETVVTEQVDTSTTETIVSGLRPLIPLIWR